MQDDHKRKGQKGPANWKNLIHLRRSDTCVFLGSGRSINTITPGQWSWLVGQDIWTVNNWVYHPFIVPHFYHIEVKSYNYLLIQQRLHEKRTEYENVNFIFPKDKTLKLDDNSRRWLHNVAFEGAKKFHYPMLGRDPKRSHQVFTARYSPDKHCMTKSYDMSLTAVFELIFHMGYETVILFGVDLHNSYYFWTGGDPKYGQVHHQTNKAHENKDPEDNHATYRLREFLRDFNYRWMKPQGREIFVGHKDTALYPILGYMEVP